MGSTGLSELPGLTGGGVFIDGDINGDGLPDVMLSNSGSAGFAFKVLSGGNRLHALELDGFAHGVGMFLPATAQTLAGNIVSGVVMNVTDGGVAGFGGPPQDSGSEWKDMRLVGNTIDSQNNGIQLGIQTAAQTVERATIANNAIQLTAPGGIGIHLSVGGGAGADHNLLSDVLVAYNSISGEGTGIGANAGGVGGSANTVEHLRVLGNHVDLTSGLAIGVGVSDGSTEFHCPSCTPIVYSDANVLKDLAIEANVLTAGAGVIVGDVNGGGEGNVVQGVRIADDVIDANGGWGVRIEVAATGGYYSRASSNNEVSGVDVTSNSVRLESFPVFGDGGIALDAGIESTTGRLHDVQLTANRVSGDRIGIHLVGGQGDPPLAATDNTVSNVSLRHNLVTDSPKTVTPAAKGLTLTGGYGNVTGNSVSCVTLQGNVIAGVLNDHSLRDNVGSGAAGNGATLGGC